MKRHQRIMRAILRQIEMPPYRRIETAIGRAVLTEELEPSSCFDLPHERTMVMGRDAFLTLAMRLCGWVPRTLLDSRYRHHRRIRP